MTYNESARDSDQFSTAGQHHPGPAPYQHVDEAQRANWRAKGSRRAVFGVLWLVAGLMITLITLANSVSSGFYIVAWGPMIGGVIQIISGMRMHGRGSS